GGHREEGAPAAEICSVDHQRLAFPMPARVAAPLADPCGKVRAPVERNHAHIVDDFLQDRYVAGGLEDLQVVVVGEGQHRRTNCGEQDAALTQGTVLGSVEFMVFLLGGIGGVTLLSYGSF